MIDTKKKQEESFNNKSKYLAAIPRLFLVSSRN